MRGDERWKFKKWQHEKGMAERKDCNDVEKRKKHSLIEM